MEGRDSLIYWRHRNSTRKTVTEHLSFIHHDETSNNEMFHIKIIHKLTCNTVADHMVCCKDKQKEFRHKLHISQVAT